MSATPGELPDGHSDYFSNFTFDFSRTWKLSFVNGLKNQQGDASTDFEIICGDATFKIHRLVATLHSSYFKRVCDTNSNFKEASERRIVLKDERKFHAKESLNVNKTRREDQKQRKEAKRAQEEEEKEAFEGNKQNEKKTKKKPRTDCPPFEVRFALSSSSGTRSHQTDVVIHCGNAIFHAQSHVLRAASTFFDIIYSSAKEDDKNITITLREDRGALLHAIRFCYRGKLDLRDAHDARLGRARDARSLKGSTGIPLKQYGQVACVADRLGMSQLKQRAVQALVEEATALYERWTGEHDWIQYLAKSVIRAMSCICKEVPDLEEGLRQLFLSLWEKDGYKLLRYCASEKAFYSLLMMLPEVARGVVSFRTSMEWDSMADFLAMVEVKPREELLEFYRSLELWRLRADKEDTSVSGEESA